MKSIKYTYLLLGILFSVLPINLFSQPQSWQSYGPGGGGALYSPSISPHNPLEIFFPTDMSVLFHTTDFGASYSIVHFKYITAGMMTKVQYTNNPKILYTINQHEFGNFPVKSTDGGISWNKLSSDPTDGGAFFIFPDDEDFNKVIVADYSNIYYSTDGGSSYQTIYQGDSGTWGSYIAGIFWDGNDIYICLPDGIYSSKNGQPFSHENQTGIASSEFIVSCTVAKSNGKIRFFAVTNGSCYPGISGAERTDYKSVYVLDYGSGNWVKKINGIKTNDDVFFASMAKNNIDIAYIAGEDNTLYGPCVYKTIDGGNTWNNVFLLQNNKNIKTGWSGFKGDRLWSYGEYALGFNVCPTVPNYLIVTDLGFPHISSDGGNSWNQAYVNKSDANPENNPTPTGKSYHSIGLEQTSCWNLEWYDKENIFAGYTDIRGCRSITAGDSWSFDYTGYTNTDNTFYQSLKHPTNGIVYGAISTVHDMYESMFLTDQRLDVGKGKVLFSTNKGKDWQVLHDFAHPVIWLALDQSNTNKMYASVIHSTLGGIYVSNDIDKGNASTWTKLSNPPRTQGHPYNIHVLNDGSLLCTYSARMSNDRKTFYPSSGVFYSSDAGPTWLDRSDANMQYWTKDVVIDPNDAAQNTWYAAVFSGWGGPANNKGGLYKTTNRGVNWTKIMDAARVESCTINPLNKNEMYAATEYEGLFITKNLNDAVPNFTLVDNYYFKHPMRVFFNPYKQDEIWITSFGNGIVKGQNGTDVNEILNSSKISIYPNPARDYIEINMDAIEAINPTLKRGVDERYEIRIFDMLGELVAQTPSSVLYQSVSYQSHTRASDPLKIDVSFLSPGIYFIKIGNRVEKFVKM